MMESLPAWGVWIEILRYYTMSLPYLPSLPAWGVWIEMQRLVFIGDCNVVAPRMGSVD